MDGRQLTPAELIEQAAIAENTFKVFEKPGIAFARDADGTIDPTPAVGDERKFIYHPPKGDQADRYKLIRSYGKTLSDGINILCPESDERDEAIKKVREAIMWANASIACNE